MYNMNTIIHTWYLQEKNCSFGHKHQGNNDPSHTGIMMDNVDHKTSLQGNAIIEQTISVTIIN